MLHVFVESCTYNTIEDTLSQQAGALRALASGLQRFSRARREARDLHQRRTRSTLPRPAFGRRHETRYLQRIIRGTHLMDHLEAE